MVHTSYIATLNINGIAAPIKMNLLSAFIIHHALDIILLQEVTNIAITHISGYSSHVNIGTDRGTVILVKEGITVQNVVRVPNGRGIAATINGICYVNVYAPSGTGRTREREEFFNNHLSPLLPVTSNNVVLAGDFNSVVDPRDATGGTPHSKMLERIIKVFNLKDVWEVTSNMHGFTHHTTHGASRIDRIYVNEHLLLRKQSTRTVAAPFTDHLAVFLHMQVDLPVSVWGRGYWKMNVAILKEEQTLNDMKAKWAV